MPRVRVEFKSNRSYRAPAFIQLAAKKKCNRDDIFVVGVAVDKLIAFWKNVNYHALSFTRPVEKGRAVVDIDSRCHKNTAELAVERSKDRNENGSESKPDDWFDQFQITSSKGESTTKTKSYQLQLSSSTTKGANFNIRIAGAGFFNVVAPSAGIAGSYSTTSDTTQTTESTQAEALSQGYNIVDTLKIPPKTKVKATITTWAVTYVSDTVTEFTVDAKAELNVRYRTNFSRTRFGGMFIKTVRITAKDLFRNEWDYKCEDELVTFKRRGTISHLGEEVEIIKERDACTLEDELNLQAVPM